MVFGEATAEAWTGLVLVYLDERDPRFVHRRRFFKTRLVFATVRGDTLLNHWAIEKREVTPFVAKKKVYRSSAGAASVTP
jgi:hypothetical protein